MEIIILGSGTGIPLSYRASPSIVLFFGREIVLLDIGPGTLRQLSKVGISHDKIGQIFLSHFHPDHTADLIHFLFVTRNPSTFEKREPFRITGPVGLRDLIDKLQKAYDHWLDIPSEMMELEELDIRQPDNKTYRDFHITARPLTHTDHSLAYRLVSRSGKSLVYSGDTGFCSDIVEFANDSDLLILECSFPEGQNVKGHLTPSEAGRIATSSRCKRLLLIHFYPEILVSDIASDCRRTYDGELVLGRDLLHLSL